jgi:hypothetical protein
MPYAFFNALDFVVSHRFYLILGVYRRTSKDIHQMQPPQTASNNSKQQLPTGTDTGRSSSARATKK